MAMPPKRITGELITIGDELLSGHVANDNAFHIAGELRGHGFHLANMVTIGDRENVIREALLQALGRSDFVVCTGGLGPTADDRTASAVAAALHLPLATDLQYEALLRTHVAKRGIAWSDELARMAMLPEGAVKLKSDLPAAGFFLLHANKPLYFLPGVPWEMRMFLSQHVLPDLIERFPHRPVYVRRVLRVQELPESQINQRLRDLLGASDEVEIGFLPQTVENWVTLLAVGTDAAEARAKIARAEREVVSKLGTRHVSGRDGEQLEQVVGELLRGKAWRLAVAESCTGGLLSAKITSIAGSSDYFERAFVTYSNRAKVELLGVTEQLLAAHGAVSRPVAAAMAEGVRQRVAVEMALAITGIAGPSGGTAAKPVGTVFIACAHDQDTVVHQHHLSGTRQLIQEKAAHAALVLLWRILAP